MNDIPRETRVLHAVVSLVDSLLDDFDVVELLIDLTERCTQLIDISAAGLLLADSRRHFAVVAPEVFSVSVDPEGVSLTLLRSPFSAHHDPFPAEERPDHHVTDQGWHDFDILLWPDAPADLAEPARLARQMLMPPIVWDLTG